MKKRTTMHEEPSFDRSSTIRPQAQPQHGHSQSFKNLPAEDKLNITI
jgi:hypothetical protein